MRDPAGSQPGTKERILDAAEALFGESGFAATSLRALTGRAGVNLAAVHYHFGSKEALLAAVLERRVEPINRERLRRLAELEQGGRPPVEAVLEAFLAPAVGMDGKTGIRPIMGRLHSEPVELVRPIFERQFGELARRFSDALAAALPELPLEEVRARFELVVGSMVHVILNNPDGSFGFLGGPPSNEDEMVRRLVAFCSAGMRAPLEREAGPALRAGARS